MLQWIGFEWLLASYGRDLYDAYIREKEYARIHKFQKQIDFFLWREVFYCIKEALNSGQHKDKDEDDYDVNGDYHDIYNSIFK